MLLSDATSKEQVEEALAAGDEELREDIESKIEESIAKIQRMHTPLFEEYEDDDIVELVQSFDFLEAVIEQSSPDVSDVPEHEVADAAARQARRGQRNEAGIFEFDENRRGRRGANDFRWSFHPNVSVFLSQDDLFENSRFVLKEMSKEFYRELDSDVEWQEGDSVICEQFGWKPSWEAVEISASESDFEEFCHDILKDHLRELIKRDPDEAIRSFINSAVEIVAQDEKEQLRSKLTLTPPTRDDLIELATSWSEADDDEGRSEVVEKIRDYYKAIEGGGSIDREEIATFSADELRQMGVTKGALIEQAPWRLIKLRSSDLRAEGTRMKHCVGDKGMGYIKAVVDGRIEIWSLRDRDDKPRFTLEVDSSFYSVVEEPRSRAELERLGTTPAELARFDRGQAIKQIKGSTNRTPGYASKHDSGTNIKFPEEVTFWKQVFTDIGVDPKSVNDFEAARQGLNYQFAKNSRRRFTPNRSFDEPYEPLGHR